jgi:hypothetical protein
MKKPRISIKKIISSIFTITGGSTIIGYIILDKIKGVPFGTHIKSFFSAVFRFMTKTFTIPVIIPAWLIFLVFIGIVFFVLWYIFWKKIRIEAVGCNLVYEGKNHVAGTETAVFLMNRKHAAEQIKRGNARIVK